jgi:hypothetical protein
MDMKELNQADYLNLRKLLDRVSVEGVQEAKVLAVLATKLENIVNSYGLEEEDGKDTPTAD